MLVVYHRVYTVVSWVSTGNVAYIAYIRFTGGGDRAEPLRKTSLDQYVPPPTPPSPSPPSSRPLSPHPVTPRHQHHPPRHPQRRSVLGNLGRRCTGDVRRPGASRHGWGVPRTWQLLRSCVIPVLFSSTPVFPNSCSMFSIGRFYFWGLWQLSFSIPNIRHWPTV